MSKLSEEPLWIIFILVVPFAIWFILTTVFHSLLESILGNYTPSILCLTSIILGLLFLVAYIKLSARRRARKKREEIERRDKYGSEGIEDGYGEKKSTSFFGRGKKCEYCGTELIYKEEYDSYYCPECHDYKQKN